MKSEGDDESEYEYELEPGFRFADDEPRWTQVARIIRDQIQRGDLPPGTRVPSMIQMQQEYGISTSTGQKVHRALRSEGLIRTQSGMGSYVKRPDTTG